MGSHSEHSKIKNVIVKYQEHNSDGMWTFESKSGDKGILLTIGVDDRLSDARI